MSVSMPHAALPAHGAKGQVALFTLVLLAAVVLLVFWNWDYVQKAVILPPQLSLDIMDFQNNTLLQFVIVFAVALAIAIAYFLTKAKEMNIQRGI